MSLRAYDSYQDSGVPWFAQVPAHWKCAAFKWEIVSNDGGVWGDDPDGEEDTIVLRSTEQTMDGRWRLDYPATRKLTPGDRRAALLLAGDLLVTKSSGSSLHIGKTTLVTPELAALGCCYSNFMQRIRMGISYSPQLAWYLLNSDLSRAQFGFLSNSTTGLANLNGTIIGEIVVPVPPPAEQATIVAFLDRETGKIDALVEEQRRLIELLKEKRQAVISHAVTKGLDPSAPMKDSGVEWLGEVPAHWEVRRLKQISISFCDGPFGSGLKSEHYVDDGVRVIRLQNIRNGTFAGEDTAFISKEYFQRELARHDVQGNDVLVAGLGDDRNAVGRACVAPPNVPPAMVKADCFRFRLRSESSPDFVAHQLSAGAVFAAGTLSLGSTRSRIPLSVMAGRVVAIPGIDEQVRIAREVAKRIAGFESLIGEAEKGIALLQERRAALISAAVTGKIDVRGWTDADVRKAVAAEIIYLNARNPTFGRVKNQKLIYLAEAHAGIHEIGGRYEREAAGPFDGALMALVERELERAGVVTVRQGVRGTAVDYALTPGWKPDRERLKAMLGDRLVAFDHVNEKLADLDTRGAEAVATLYAVWNDALIDGEAYDDTRVIRGFLDEWHPEKREKFSEAKLREWLGWMRRNGLTPQGRGPKTAAESLFK